MPTKSNDQPRQIKEARREPSTESASDHMVYVVDDDPGVRDALADLLAACGYNARTFASAEEFIDSDRPRVVSCLILDIELPDINGLDLQRQLAGAAHPPIVFITGHADIPSSVRAMKAGAMDFLSKPFTETQLLAAVNAALAHDRQTWDEQSDLDLLRERYAALTPRERETLPLIVSGLRNKQTAAVLGISVVTTQIHRGNILRKMQAASLSDLVRMAEKLQIPQDVARYPELPGAQ